MKEATVGKNEAPSDAPEIERMQVTMVRHCIGTGVPGDPYRCIEDYFADDGEFLARYDPTQITTRAQGGG